MQINSDFDEKLQAAAKRTNAAIARLLESCQMDADIRQPVRYTLDAGGKRVRAAVVLWCCELVSGKANPDAETAAAAIEMVHTYSLVHDDLPAMDDDDFRRGKPSCHKAFGEAEAILTGDALLTLAFQLLATEISDPNIAVKLIKQLAEDAGPAGMIAGQIADIKAEKTTPDEKTLQYIHINKTAKMFRCSAACGAIAGRASHDDINRLSEYGLKLGLAFQVADDILDVISSTDQLGKTAGKDQKTGKLTYPALFGLDKAKKLLQQLTAQAAAALTPFGDKANTLLKLTTALQKRKS
ncbi:MAG: polyprenyl synthetase family protein [Phycisphaerae bacterium]|nr:polyprenyl synthetase family protein [Phycisphaerae bacterium]